MEVINNHEAMEYQTFLNNKLKKQIDSGFDIQLSDLNPMLFDFQKHCVSIALKKGKYALFEECGLGKTFQQLEWAYQVSKFTSKPVLILCPLAVAGQTIIEGQKLGIEVIKYDGSNHSIQISNYEQLDNIDTSLFSGIVLDESSILKSFTGVYKNLIIDKFQDTPYKLACTATPSPNDIMEIGNHSEFLDVMGRNEMLAMFFVHDGGETAKWRLKGHGTKYFYKFMSEWSIMISDPSDIGFDGSKYKLPKLNIEEQVIKTPKRDNQRLFNDHSVSATNFNSELRLTKIDRMDTAIKIVNASEEKFIIWVKQNEEGDYLRKLIPGAIEVKGSDTPEYKESKLLGFANNEFRVLITKTKIAQFGLNYQNCQNQIFSSMDFSFEGLYQAIRRSYRFGQKKQVNIHIITTDTMDNVLNTIKRKEAEFNTMKKEMSHAMKNAIEENKEESIRQFKEVKSDQFTIQLGDCVKLIKEIESESIGFSVFSPPFSELYTYSDQIEDMGNSKNYEDFMFAFKLLVKDLYRVLWSGRNVAVHCMDLPIQKGKEGFIGLKDFSNMIRQAFEDCGFIYHSRITLWKDPVVEMVRTKALGLLHKQVKKDSTMSRVGIPDYLLVFRKDGEREHPVKCDIPVDLWQKYASPVWMDIDYGNTLNREGKESKDEKHICPLQLDTIERAIHLWSNKGDTVYTPFAGIGSEMYQALKMGRKAIGMELKESYYETAVRNCMSVVESKKQLEFQF